MRSINLKNKVVNNDVADEDGRSGDMMSSILRHKYKEIFIIL